MGSSYNPITGEINFADSAATIPPSNPLWERPSDWLAMPDLSGDPQAISGLFAVYDNESNFVTITAAGNYTVDWGDGSAVENISSGVKAEHNYVFTDLNVSTLTSQGFRQALIKITPQGGANLTSFNVTARHTDDTLTTGGPSNYTWLDIHAKTPSLTTLNISTSTTAIAAARSLQNFEFIGSNSMTSMSACFSNALSLQRVVLYCNGVTGSMANLFDTCIKLTEIHGLETANPNDCTSMFNGNRSLVVAPELTLAATCNSAFNTCPKLEDISLLDFTNVTNATSMFNACVKLSDISYLFIPALLTADNMFQNCGIVEIPDSIDFSSITSASAMFQGCALLTSVGDLNFENCTVFASFLRSCTILKTTGVIDTSAGLNFSEMFRSSTSLESIGAMDFSSGTNFSDMFNTCSSLLYLPAMDTSAGTNFSGFLQSCIAIREIPDFNMAAATNAANCFSGCRSIGKGILANPPAVSHSYQNCRLSASEIDAIFTALPIVVSGTITVTGNFGVPGMTAALATAKNWTVSS